MRFWIIDRIAYKPPRSPQDWFFQKQCPCPSDIQLCATEMKNTVRREIHSIQFCALELEYQKSKGVNLQA